jgi:hypothetical protein
VELFLFPTVRAEQGPSRVTRSDVLIGQYTCEGAWAKVSDLIVTRAGEYAQQPNSVGSCKRTACFEDGRL